jgi:rRNA small subunit pseudouridine methyltransferase Nep1
MINLILAESALELVPKEMQGEPLIKMLARKRGKAPGGMLLDSNLHYRAMKRLPDAERRGRPDLVHFSLLLALDSVLNRRRMLRVFVHTRNDEVIHVNPSVRLPRSYERFCGIAEQLFEKRRIASEGEILLEIKSSTLAQLLAGINPDGVALMHEKGAAKKPIEFAKSLAEHENPCVIVGGFPHGDFAQRIEAELVSFYPEQLCVWTIVGEVIFALENFV